ncbi:amidohydrolase family protein [Tahibacter caeni]|uniref:amidohydrolase family protein n=1 Tax=Tahibacter caeni TaxID=1453545 RepID=UPI0021477393
MQEQTVPHTHRRRGLPGLGFLLSGYVLTATAVAGADATPPARPTIAIVGVNVVDLERARPPALRTVLIEDGRIVAVADPRHAVVPARAQRIDGRGRFLIPGLVDLHVHLFNLASRRAPNDWAFPLFVANGVTAVREMSTDAAGIAQIRNWHAARERGELVAPRIAAAGIAVRGESPEAAVAAVEAAADAGADFVKVFSPLPQAQWQAVLATAQRRGLPVVGHVPAQVALQAAAVAGQRDNEHLMQAIEACSSVETELLQARAAGGQAVSEQRLDAEALQAVRQFDARRCRDVAVALAAAGQVQVPTLVLPQTEARDGAAALSADPRWIYLRADERLRWQRAHASLTAADHRLFRARWPALRRIASVFRREGVELLAGTDAPMPGVYPGYSLHEELALLVAAGLSPRAALRAATLAPARLLGQDTDFGTVAVGRCADLVLLDADPTRDIGNARRIRAVVLDGRVLTRDALDALLADAARAQ